MKTETPKDILVVDDTPANLRLLLGILSEQGYEVRPAPNGARALSAVQRQQPDLILLDINMPGMSGYEVCEKLKADERTRDIPVIFISALSEVLDKVKAFSVGGVDYITKPFQVEEVLARVETHISLRDMQVILQEKNNELNQRTRDLSLALDHLKEAQQELKAKNEHIMSSIEYAERIQRSMLPNPDDVRAWLPQSFFIWEPKDVVGGDIYVAESFDDGMVIAVIDCTGHGVPGAFMSMLASSFTRRIIRSFGCLNPAEILKRLNLIVKTSLQQDTEYAVSDDGMDAAVCFIEVRGEGREVRGEESRMIFAGAKLPLFYVRDGKVNVIRGDRQSIGYKKSDIGFDFTNHTIPIEKETSFYMSTDGFWDQLGKNECSRFGRSSFGKKRFENLLREVRDLPFEEQQKRFLEVFHAHKGDIERQDDVMVVGFRI